MRKEIEMMKRKDEEEIEEINLNKISGFQL
jgi:hypothetical protein